MHIQTAFSKNHFCVSNELIADYHCKKHKIHRRSNFSDTPMQPTFKELQHLIFLAEEQHFARAAQRAYLSQSAFSRSIGALESTLGLRLFDRDSRRVHITADGERIVRLARRTLASATDLTREAQLLRDGEVGHLAIGSGPYTSSMLTVPIISVARRSFHNVQFRLDVDHSAALLQRLEDEEIHVFLSDVHEIPSNGPWAIELLGSYHSTVICRAGHAIATRSCIEVEDLAQLELASVHIPQPLHQRLAKVWGYPQIERLPIVFECESVTALREFLLHSDAVVIAPPALFRHELESGLLTQLTVQQWLPLERNPMRVDLGMVWLSDRTPTSAMRMLMDLVRKEAAPRLYEAAQLLRPAHAPL